MKSIDISILESKLKRHKISYEKKNNKLIIGKSKIDYPILIALIIVPTIIAIFIIIILIFYNIELVKLNTIKFIAAIIFFFSTSLFYLSRMKIKKSANNNIKIIYNETIVIKNKDHELKFSSSNIKDILYTSAQINEDVFEGSLHLIDDKYQQYQILGFDDDNEKYVLNDLKWFSEYFIKYLNLNLPYSD